MWFPALVYFLSFVKKVVKLLLHQTHKSLLIAENCSNKLFTILVVKNILYSLYFRFYYYSSDDPIIFRVLFIFPRILFSFLFGTNFTTRFVSLEFCSLNYWFYDDMMMMMIRYYIIDHIIYIYILHVFLEIFCWMIDWKSFSFYIFFIHQTRMIYKNENEWISNLCWCPVLQCDAKSLYINCANKYK